MTSVQHKGDSESEEARVVSQTEYQFGLGAVNAMSEETLSLQCSLKHMHLLVEYEGPRGPADLLHAELSL
jgi:hypothetical protein